MPDILFSYRHVFIVLLYFMKLLHSLDDWKSILGDPTKFGFGALSVFFDLILIFQHMFYRGRAKRTNHSGVVEEGNIKAESIDNLELGRELQFLFRSG